MEEDTSKQSIQSLEKIDDRSVPDVDVLELSVPAEPKIRKMMDFDIKESYGLSGYDLDGDAALQQTHCNTHYTETSVNAASDNNGKQKKAA